MARERQERFSCTDTQISGKRNRYVLSSKGKTVLYIPQEDVSDPLLASKDKDLTQRLESTVIHWTRQIKEVVNSSDMFVSTERSGPLDEIEFWKNRTIDLSGISDQLVRPGVASIVEVLDHAKSSYLGPFQVLSNLIQQNTAEAMDNLKFLSILRDCCLELAGSRPIELPQILPKLLVPDTRRVDAVALLQH